MRRITARIAVILLSVAVLISFMPVTGLQSAYATIDVTQEGTINITPTVKYESNPRVVVSWDFNSGLTAGSYVERYDAASDTSSNVGSVSSDYSYKLFYDNNVVPGNVYLYRIVNGSNYTNWSAPVEVPAASESSDSGSSDNSGSGGAGGSSDSGSTDSGASDSGSSGSSSGSTAAEKPKLSDVTVGLTSSAAGKIDIVYLSNGSDQYAVYGLQVKYGSKTVLDADTGYSSGTKSVTVPYGKTVKFKYRVYRARTVNSKESDRVYSDWGTLKGKCATLKKPTLSATKISSSKVGLAWNRVPGATGYKIYCGSKLIKTIKKGSTVKYTYTKSGAASKSYRVRAVLKNSKMKKAVMSGYSKAKKGKENSFKDSYSTSIKSMKYATAKFDVSKVSLSGSTYTLTGYVLNNRIFDLVKYQNMQVTVFCYGKKVASKKFRNLKCSVKAGDVKKFTIRLKGKSGVDLRNGGTFTITGVEPYWKSVGSVR